MRPLSVLLTYLVHPLLTPLIGTFFYFRVTPKFSPPEMERGSVLPVFILTVIIPLVSLLILKNLGLIRSFRLEKAEERIYPLLVFLVLLLMILFRIIPARYSDELYFFFLGMVLVTLACLMVALTGKRVSLHMVGAGTLLMYLIGLSIHFEKNIILAISACALFSGLVGTARLYLGIHGRAAVLIGFLMGAVSQLLLFRFWI